MHISLNWLNDYLDLSNIAPEELAKRFTMSTAELESAHYIGKHFEQVKAARIDKIEDHPNSDKLHLATVFDGTESITVVCGAPNIALGQIIPYAPLGTILPGDFEIKPAKIRGVESCGMLCSAKELGLGEDHSGIWQLEKSIQPGTKMSEIFGESDFVIEIENKTINHRPDLWGHYGIARELRTIFRKEWKKELSYKGIKADKIEESFNIEFGSSKVLHYLCVKVSGIKVGESPLWLKKRLENTGLRSINNVVDITNYIMLETAHPLHAFDRKKLAGNTIFIKDAANGEKFVTLDNIERNLLGSDIVIADSEKTLAVAGVMGGLFSEVDENTTEIVIESALFEPGTIRRTANRLDLRTDAAQRFEKAMWPENSFLAAERCIELIKEIIPTAIVSSEVVSRDNSAGYGFKGSISITPDRIRNYLGVSSENMPDSLIEEILSFLEFGVEKNPASWKISVPPHRRSKDVSIDADIVEEIGRIYGFNNIPESAPLFPMLPAVINKGLEKQEKLRDLLSRNFCANEVLNYSFLCEKDKQFFNLADEEAVVLLGVKDSPYLRWTMAPAMFRNIESNQKFFPAFSIFEFGSVYKKESENKRFAAAIYGKENVFEETKKIVESILKELNVPNFKIERVAETSPFFGSLILHPGRGGVITCLKQPVGIFGEIHPSTAKKYDLKGRAGYIEIDLDKLFSMPESTIKFNQLNKMQSSFFEFSLVVPLKTEADILLSVIKNSIDKKILSEYKITDRFAGHPIPEGMQSISFKIELNAGDRTMTGDEIKGVQDKLINDYRKKGFKLKGDE